MQASQYGLRSTFVNNKQRELRVLLMLQHRNKAGSVASIVKYI